MKIEDLKTEKIIKLFGLQSGCMSEEKLWEIIKINKDHNFVRFNNSIKSYDTIKNLRAEKVYYHTELEGVVIRIREYGVR